MTGRSGAPFMEEADKCDGAENDPRTLIHIGIVHTEADMGALSESIQRATLQRLSVKAWRRKLRAIDKRWTEIEEIVERLPLPRGKVRLYQDGLPVCGRELEIVEELANQGSRNHRLLLRLIEKGAVIMGTESPDLLLEEYERVKQALVLQNVRRGGGSEILQSGRGDSLLDRRNRFIADRINTTLCAGETGVLFLGMLHSLENLLDKDIKVIYPVAPPFA